MNNISNKISVYEKNLKQIEILNLELKKIRKKPNKHLYYWLLIPIFGVFIFYTICQARVNDEQYLAELADCKIKISKLQIENIQLLAEIKKQGENNNENN